MLGKNSQSLSIAISNSDYVDGYATGPFYGSISIINKIVFFFVVQGGEHGEREHKDHHHHHGHHKA